MNGKDNLRTGEKEKKKQEDTISQLEGTVKLKAMKPKSFLESSRSNRLSK